MKRKSCLLYMTMSLMVGGFTGVSVATEALITETQAAEILIDSTIADEYYIFGDKGAESENIEEFGELLDVSGNQLYEEKLETEIEADFADILLEKESDDQVIFSDTLADTATIVESGKWGPNAEWTLDEQGTLIISGTGAISDIDDYISDTNRIVSVMINKGITTIGGFAFNDCYSLTSITIPDSVTSIGDYAFKSCFSLAAISIPDRVTVIGEATVLDCDSLTSITIPDSVNHIGNYAVGNWSSLTEINVEPSHTE